GGRTIEAAAPLDLLPLFVRAGSIIPMGPVVQHCGEALDARLEVRVFDGADASFTLYEDENDNYNYERGEYRMTRLAWDDVRRTFAAEPSGRELRVVRVEP